MSGIIFPNNSEKLLLHNIGKSHQTTKLRISFQSILIIIILLIITSILIISKDYNNVKWNPCIL